MDKHYRFWFWQTAPICPLLVCFLTLPASRGMAQVVPDGSLGSELSKVNAINGSSDRIYGGATRGSNLFHSFQRFDIQAGHSVYFSNPAGVTNIFSRVTGGLPSNIDGTLGVSGSANLFFINPNGITFGSGAHLDLKGSFVASTASGILFPNGERFSASTPQFVPLLTVNSVAPIGLIFEENPGAIKLQNAHLSIEPETTMALVGGDINISDSSLMAHLGSRLELGAVKDLGTIGLAISPNDIRLRFPSEVMLANVYLNNGTSIRSIIKKSNQELDPSEDAGARFSGQVHITGNNITLSNRSEIVAESGIFIGPYDLLPADININSSGQVRLRQSSSIMNLSGGYIAIQANQLLLTDKSEIKNKIDAQPQYDSINEKIGVGSIVVRIQVLLKFESLTQKDFQA